MRKPARDEARWKPRLSLFRLGSVDNLRAIWPVEGAREFEDFPHTKVYESIFHKSVENAITKLGASVHGLC